MIRKLNRDFAATIPLQQVARQYLARMRMLHFNPEAGYYHFELADLDSDLHHHPITEVLWTPTGTFTLQDDSGVRRQQFAVVPSNAQHAIRYSGPGPIHILMIDLPRINIKANDILVSWPQVAAGSVKDWAPSIARNLARKEDHPEWNHTAATALTFLRREAGELEYADLLRRLSSECHLSKSRLSHQFRAGVGTSVRAYYLWLKLLRATKVLLGNGSYNQAGYAGGFYDQAHFSRTFKRFMGLNLKDSYNSDFVQK